MGASEANKTVGGLSEASQQEMLLRERKANSAWRKLCRNKSAMIGLVLVAFVTIVSLFGPMFYSVDPAAMDFLKVNAKPGTPGFPLGADNLGRDMLARLIHGGRVSLIVAVGGMAVGAVIGILIGLVAAQICLIYGCIIMVSNGIHCLLVILQPVFQPQ